MVLALLALAFVLMPSPHESASADSSLTRYDQTDSRLVYSGPWAAFAKDVAYKGSYARANTSGSSVTITFEGTYLAWVAMKGTTTGKADVYLDGVFQKTVNLANSVAIYQQTVWSTGPLSNGVHTVKISWNPTNVVGKYITIDAVDVAGSLLRCSRFEQTHTQLSYTGTWATATTSSASGGSLVYAGSARSSVTVRFDGTYLAWIARKSPGSGVAKVSLDEGPPVTVDLYGPSAQYGRRVWDTGMLAQGIHTVTIEWTGARNVSATDSAISVDAFDVAGRLLPAPTRVDLLTPRQLAGQRVIYSYSGLTPPDSLLSLIRKGEAAGVIFFGGNISSISQIAAVCAQLRAANASLSNPVRAPLLLMTDQEGGKVRRLPGEPLLSAKEIGRSDDPGAEAARAGAGAANNLKAAGMNVNLAPVLDVYRQEGDFSDRAWRSYSSDPEIVSLCGSSFIKAQQELGVAATAKHFPGLGSATTSQNTDGSPVTLSVSLDSLRTIDEFPYVAAMAADVRLIMLSWAVYPALDAAAPAGMSSKVVQGELRGRLGFKGVTITDALEAGALQSIGGTGQRVLRSADAGVDLLLCSARSVSQGQSALTALETGYTSGALSRAGFEESVRRILGLRFDLGR